MAKKPVPVSVEIMGSTYRLGCAEKDRQKLMDAAQYLNDKIQQVKETGKVLGIEKLAVMAALDISCEIIDVKLRNEVQEKDHSVRLSSLETLVQQKLDDLDNQLNAAMLEAELEDETVV